MKKVTKNVKMPAIQARSSFSLLSGLLIFFLGSACCVAVYLYRVEYLFRLRLESELAELQLSEKELSRRLVLANSGEQKKCQPLPTEGPVCAESSLQESSQVLTRQPTEPSEDATHPAHAKSLSVPVEPEGAEPLTEAESEIFAD